jgi:CRISPR-associated protein Cas2
MKIKTINHIWRSDEMRRVICYDIRDEKRRNKAFKLLKDYGTWVQNSIFELEVDDVTWAEIDQALQSIVHEEDALSIYCLCQRCQSAKVVVGENQLNDCNPII